MRRGRDWCRADVPRGGGADRDLPFGRSREGLGDGVRRLLPVSRRAGGRDPRRRHGRHPLRRVYVIEKLLVEQIEVLETMSPQDFLAFRSQLAPASGFQSVQFREIEFLSGLKEPAYLARLEATPDELNRLRRRLEEPSLADAFRMLVRRRGSPPLRDIYTDRERFPDLFDLCEALLDHDETFALWRSRHVLMVERQIGGKPGTGGSSGADYLRSTLGKRFFPELWDVRTTL